MNNIGVVIVTFNRLEKLKIALEAFEQQVATFKYLCVVNNASTDGTGSFLQEWLNIDSRYEKILINMEYNTGGSGGFYKGLEKALELDAEWIWVSDDDAFPEKDALAEAYKFLESDAKTEDISALCGSVINFEKYDLSHRKILMQNGIKVNTQLVPPPNTQSVILS